MIKYLEYLLEMNERTPAWLSRKLGVSRTLVYSWLNRKRNISGKHFAMCLQVFDVPIEKAIKEMEE